MSNINYMSKLIFAIKIIPTLPWFLRGAETSTRPDTNYQTNTETKARRAGRLR